ncbi:MAG: glycosyltransferase family 39 protein [Prolixibacteraceae bacterium]|nr:glycosyltransferase family 39 protein [Prolixibacteraceae bacterium]
MKTKNIISRIPTIIFLLLLLVLSYIYDFQKIIVKEPQSIHLWRQCDCLSFAQNYYKENIGFFEPEVHQIGVHGNGKTVSDFPLIYYLVGKTWRITGQHEYIFRGLVLLLFFTGLYFLHRTLIQLFQNKIWAIVIPLILFTSPVLVYYSNNFLMNVPAFSLVLIAWYFFFRFYKTSQIKWLWVTMGLLTFAGLFKTTALLSYFALLGVFIIENLKIYQFRKSKPVFTDLKKEIFPFIMVILLIVAWVTFAVKYNDANNRGFFLVGIRPIWQMDSAAISKTFHDIRTYWIMQNFPKYFQIIVVALWLAMLVLPRRNNRFFYYLNLVLAIGVISYLLLFYQVIAGHDYYWINLYILLLMTLVSFAYFIKKNFPKIFPWSSLVFVVLLVFNIIYCDKKIDLRYHGSNMNYYNMYLKNYSSIKNFNREHGITRDDLVISLPEGTINGSLYLMDQKGWTSYGADHENQKYYIDRIQRGAKYLFVSDSTLLEQDYIQPFIQDKIGKFKSIEVFDLRKIDIEKLQTDSN